MMNNSIDSSTNTSIDIFKKYPDEQYNLVVPIKSFTQISPLHKISVNVVQLSTNVDDGDIYPQKKNKDEYSPTKKGLMKLMAAANIQPIQSNSVTPSSCKRCIAIAREALTQPPCMKGIECDSKNDVAWSVIISVPDLAGGQRYITATREFLCETEREKMKKDDGSDFQYKQAYGFRSAHAESKALLRALRAAFAIKPTYKLKELEKPFAIPVISLNYDDKDVRKAALQRFANGANSLYPGGHFGGAQQIPENLIECADDDEDENTVEAHVVDSASESPEHAPFNDFIECQECGAVLEPFTDSKGSAWTVQRIKDYGNQHFGKTLCGKCIATAEQARKKGAA